MVPIVGVGAAAVAEVAAHASTVRSDLRVKTLVQATVDLNDARADLQREILPALTGSVVSNPTVRAGLGLNAEQSKILVDTIGELPELRAKTDDSLETMLHSSELQSVAKGFQAQVIQLRNVIDAGTYAHTAFTAAMDVMDAFTSAQNDRVKAAVRDGLNPAAIRALSDLDVVSHAVEYAGGQAGYFVASQFPGLLSPAATAQVRWVESWGNFESGSEAVLDRTTSPTRLAWSAALDQPATQSLDAIMTGTIDQHTLVGTTATMQVVIGDPARNAALVQVQRDAAKRVLAATQEQQTAAIRALVIIVALCLLIVAASFGAARRVQRALTQPLQRLAHQADKVSQGELIDVAVTGPREVRTVARGLAASVNSLRIIEAQAASVAAGNLADLEIGGASAVAMPGPLGSIVHASVSRIVTAIRDRERAQRALAHRAAHDALTELPNRAQALLQVESALHRAQRSSAMTGLMFVDLDWFKDVNDTFGHAAGDEVLQTIALRMREILRSGDTVARLGGDEFVILLESVVDEADCFRLAERVVEVAAEPIHYGQQEIAIGASVGVAICRDGYVDASRLLREAEAAVHQAKSAGRGRIGIFDDDLRAEIDHRFELEQSMLAALRHEEFVLYYQPVVDLRTGIVRGMEALIRWQRPGHGLVGPDEFIPTAEGSTLINDIGRWVLNTATTQLAAWTAQYPELDQLSMAVNISGRHLASPQLHTEVADALAACAMPAHQLVIEVTETVLVDNMIAKRNLHGLRELGVLIAIDDFGTGYTSIGQLPLLPVDILKIDRSFIASTDPGSQELTRLMVAAAHAFDLTVVAEGIEFEDQADALRDAAVETGQGYLFARPLPPTEMLRYLLASLDVAPARLRAVQ